MDKIFPWCLVVVLTVVQLFQPDPVGSRIILEEHERHVSCEQRIRVLEAEVVALTTVAFCIIHVEDKIRHLVPFDVVPLDLSVE